MFERILITGYSGFVGPWVVAELRRRFPRAVICGAARRLAAVDGKRATPDRCYRLDFRNPDQIRSVVEETQPDAVVHLASLKMAALDELLAVNVVGCDLLLSHVSAVAPRARTIVIGSSAELGHAAESDVPLNEAAPCRPVDHYGVTKLAQTAIASIRALLGQDVVLLRPFNLLGPNMPGNLLAGRCVAQLCAAVSSRPCLLEFGPLDARRDYLDVRDLARAVALALGQSPSGALFHIGSGMSRSGHDLVNALIKESGLDATYRTAAAADRALVPWQTADSGRAGQLLGWQPTISWRQSIRDIWNSAQAEMIDPPLRPVTPPFDSNNIAAALPRNSHG